MFIVELYVVVIIMCFIIMICWGLWVNIIKFVSNKKWEFFLFYWDYLIGLLLCFLLFVFMLGFMGEVGCSFIFDIQQVSSSSLMLVILVGIIFNIFNIFLVVFINFVGMVVVFFVGVGLVLVLGVIIIYIGNLQGDLFILFFGVVCVVIVIIFIVIVYGCVMQEVDKFCCNKGFIIVILVGIIMGWFFCFLVDFMFDNFSQFVSGLMMFYLVFVLFVVGLFLLNFVFNRLVMKKFILGELVNGKMYFFGSLWDYVCGWLGGMIWCVGLVFSLIVFGQVGYVIFYGLGQGVIMIVVIWGVFIWREFVSVLVGINKLLLIMFILYIVGIVFIIVVN